MSVKKIFIGLSDIASQVGVYKRGFEANGVETMTAIYQKTGPYVEGEADYSIDEQIRFKSITADKKSHMVAREAYKNSYREYIW
ncbi:MAG: hypothetical protein GY757_18490, partial [bacterium]|nr:hypothetical protein [bacterium]